MKVQDVKRLFVDTNILIFATNELSEWHLPAERSLQEARQLGIDLIISSQVLREYLAAATRISIIGNGLPLPKILENVRIFRNEFIVVEDNPFVLDALIDIFQKVQVAGKQVHDANIVATMQVHGLKHLLTHNIADFSRFSSFIAVIPLEKTDVPAADAITPPTSA
jgi:predicted nucleic acid-binding protein